MKVCIVAVPLAARSGVYMSAMQLVESAREMGLDWSAVVGIREDSNLAPSDQLAKEWFCEATVSGSNPIARYWNALRLIETSESVRSADVVLSFIPYTDMVLSRLGLNGRKKWVPYVRGLPWPAIDETSRLRRTFWKSLESLSLRSAPEVWATTEVLAEQISAVVDAKIIPAGIKLPTETVNREEDADLVVWAGRMSVDKNPEFFLEVMSGLDAQGAMYGTGVKEAELRATAPANVEVVGWKQTDSLWDNAALFVGTSTREAFGRSAVEAAASGLPIVVAEGYGAAPLLYTDPELRSRFVLPLDATPRWKAAITDLTSDPGLRREVAEHVRSNSMMLSIARSARAVDDRLSVLFPANGS